MTCRRKPTCEHIKRRRGTRHLQPTPSLPTDRHTRCAPLCVPRRQSYRHPVVQHSMRNKRSCRRCRPSPSYRFAHLCKLAQPRSCRASSGKCTQTSCPAVRCTLPQCPHSHPSTHVPSIECRGYYCVSQADDRDVAVRVGAHAVCSQSSAQGEIQGRSRTELPHAEVSRHATHGESLGAHSSAATSSHAYVQTLAQLLAHLQAQ